LSSGGAVPPSATGPVVTRQLAVFAAVQLAVRDYEPRPCAEPLHLLTTTEPAEATSFWAGMTPQLVTAEVDGVSTDDELPPDERIHAVLNRWIVEQPAIV